ncbi:MAG: DUF3124 domain-containing protein [Deltaproteobacteria bacterium]|nr:DUF3124 domain-containing protein [Deltaproteobacteria bacterium]
MLPLIRSGVLLAVFLATLTSLRPSGAQAASGDGLSKGQLVYVPVYSHVYYGDRERMILLTAILSIRNTDVRHAITVVKADYYDSEGKLIRRYLSQPVTLKPMASTRFVVKESDTCGGSGANFLVEWQAETEVDEPIMEGVMIGAAVQQGISFTSRGKAIRKH